MAQYAAAEQNASSESASVQAVRDWNAYIDGRAGWDLSASDVTTIGDADWNARQAGSPTIAAQQIANAATQIINNTLSTMSASQQESTFEQYEYLTTPIAIDPPYVTQGTFAANWADPIVTATQNGSGTWTVSVSADEFSSLKSFFQQEAPGMMSAGSNFNPGEAMIVLYSAATCDRGYGNGFTSDMAGLYATSTGLTPGTLPFGSSGYVCRRPVGTFLTESDLSQLFSDLGF